MLTHSTPVSFGLRPCTDPFSHWRQLKRRENAILTAERTSSFVPHRVTMADKKERRGKANFASIGRMGRIDSKTIFFGLYPENPVNRCKKFASLLCPDLSHARQLKESIQRHFLTHSLRKSACLQRERNWRAEGRQPETGKQGFRRAREEHEVRNRRRFEVIPLFPPSLENAFRESLPFL